MKGIVVTTETMTMIGLGVLIASLAYRFWPRAGGRAAAPANRPVSVIDAYDAAGREAAQRYVDEALGKARAKRFAQDISEALGVIERPASAPPPTTAPNG